MYPINLNSLVDQLSDCQVGPSEIRWAGFPGWTTKDLRNNVNVPSSSRSQDGLEIQLQKDDYDVVVILAGTNDLGRGIEPEDIVDNLTFLYGLCHSHNVSKVLAVAIPDSHYLARNSDARGRRDRVTELMEKYGNESRGFLSVVRPTFGWSDSGKTLYDRDGLHLNELGYERLAKDVAAAIMKHVPKAKK
jgi:lysophospholipase L1-like esterase